MSKKEATFISTTKSITDPVFLIPLALTVFGIIIVRSATGTLPDGGIRVVMMQILGFIIGLVSAILLSKINIRSVKHFGGYLFLGSFAMLVLVLIIGTGADEFGSKSWFRFGFISFQPAEVAKLTFIIISAVFLERIRKKQDLQMNYIKLFFYSGIIIILILLQKDYGMVAVFVFIFMVMLFIAGISRKFILAAMGLVVTSLPIVWFFLLNDARKNRIYVFLNPEMDPLGAGFNVVQSKLAIGSGRLFGQGLFNGYLNNRALVPVKESDFIFAVVGEELGFIGTIVVVILFTVFLFRILYLAKNTQEGFRSLVCYGIFAMFAFHFIQNVAMTIGLLPVTGLPLPFISAGGTALLSYYLAIGILAAISNTS